MLKFICVGMYILVQDGGWEGQCQWGISCCGVLDKLVMIIVNLLVGNVLEVVVLEIMLGQVDVQFICYCWFVLIGVVCEVMFDGVLVWLGW